MKDRAPPLQAVDSSTILGQKVGIIVALFNEDVTEKLKEQCAAELTKNGVDFDCVSVPGSLEIPVVAKKMIKTQKYSSLIAIGCVIKGDTIHFDIVAHYVSSALMSLSVDHCVPIINGVLTVNTLEQALERVDTRAQYFARAALQMTAVLNRFDFDDFDIVNSQ